MQKQQRYALFFSIYRPFSLLFVFHTYDMK